MQSAQARWKILHGPVVKKSTRQNLLHCFTGRTAVTHFKQKTSTGAWSVKQLNKKMSTCQLAVLTLPTVLLHFTTTLLDMLTLHTVLLHFTTTLLAILTLPTLLLLFYLEMTWSGSPFRASPPFFVFVSSIARSTCCTCSTDLPNYNVFSCSLSACSTCSADCTH